MTNALPLSTTFLLGALHSLEPGHGKSFLAAFVLGNRSNFKVVFTMLGSLLISHFLLLTLIAILLQFIFNGVSNEYVLETTSWFAPIIVISFGMYLFGRYLKFRKHPVDCSCGHDEKHLHHHDSTLIRKSAIAGLIGGLIPCPTAVATLLFAGMVNQFQNVLFYIFIYIIGMLMIYLLLILLLHLSKQYMAGRLDKLSSKFHPQLVSSILIICIGSIYLVYHFIH